MYVGGGDRGRDGTLKQTATLKYVQGCTSIMLTCQQLGGKDSGMRASAHKCMRTQAQGRDSYAEKTHRPAHMLLLRL